MTLYKRGYKKTKSASKSKRLYKSKPKISLAVKRYVKSTIHRNEENKCAQTTQILAVGSYANSSTLKCAPLTPYAGYLSILQGTGQGDRIGNSIRVVKAMFRYVLIPTGYDAVTNPSPIPQEFMIVFGNRKYQKGLLPGAADFNVLYQNGSTAQPPHGDVRDLICPMNRDAWNIKKVIRHKIGTASATGSGANGAQQYYANNDFKMNVVKSINITKIYPKLCKFNDNSASLNGDGLFMFCQSLNASGTTSLNSTTPTIFEYWLDVTYEDA